MSKRITLKQNMIGYIHLQKNSAGPERFIVTIHVDSMPQVKTSQLLKENKTLSN